MHGFSDLQRCEQVPGFGDGFLGFLLGCSFGGSLVMGSLRSSSFYSSVFFLLVFFFFGLFPELLSLVILLVRGS
jgi:hypothetical protein